ncbi:MAG: 3'(2'),5'-bisphosphate nucleotidase CysQ [Dehalococcoidia bacterium]|nr:3'(2'),5'-bisphosphate nucleotidase CysQ [Dehalococcoidia bacterium]
MPRTQRRAAPHVRGGCVAELDLDALRAGLEAAVLAAADAIREVLTQDRILVGHKHGQGPVTEADHAADDVLHARLMPLVGGAQWLSEESRQIAPLLHGEPTWVVDPLDGTREFLRGLPEFGVSVALFVDDRLALGALALPAQRELFSGLLDGQRREARRNGKPIAALPGGGEVRRVVVSRHDYERRGLQHQIPYDVYPCGSAAVKLAHLVEGRADVYFSSGPRSVWDVAGGAAVLRAAGGELVGYGGDPLALSPRRVRVPPYAAGARAACVTLLRKLGAAF